MKKTNLSWVGALLVFALLLWCTAATPGTIADPASYAPAVYSSMLSLLPPVVAIVLALNTKEVYTSLLVGIATGALLFANGNLELALNTLFFNEDGGMVAKLSDSSNVGILVFLVMLGILVALMNKAGGSAAFGRWASTHIHTRAGAQFATLILGMLIFVDDYFNCLTVGAVMRPITDRFRMSHEKLAWLIDSSAAPVCIIAPVSSWAVAVGGYLGDDGFNLFVQSIPYNFYALATIVFVFFVAFIGLDFGLMKKAEEAAAKYGSAEAEEVAAANPGKIITHPDEVEGDTRLSVATERTAAKIAAKNNPQTAHDLPATVIAEETELAEAFEANKAEAQFKGMEVSNKGKVSDLIVPILVLIVFSIWGMLYIGGFFEGVEFAAAVGENPVAGLCIGSFVALVVAAAMYLPRGLCTLQGYMEGVAEGVRSMVGAIMILVLAWSLGGVCRYMIGTGPFVSGFLNGLGISLTLLPFAIFLVAAFIGFSMGTSWGTIALILPIVVGVFDPADPLFLVAIGATLGGAVYGDHISPISDTTILSSAGAECNHMAHVSTQIPYASIVFVSGAIGYVLAGIMGSPWIPLALTIVLACGGFVVIAKIMNKKDAAA